MRKTIFFGFIALGGAVGLLATLDNSWSVKLVMAVFGALVGSALGGALSRIGRSGQPLAFKEDGLRGLGTTPDDLMDNYWRDQGHPQFMKPPSADSKQLGGNGGGLD
jgi:hypothetical protein